MARESRELAEFLAAFANELTSGDAESAVRRLSPQDDLLVVGTDQAEWLEDAEAIRDAFRKEAGSVRAQLEHTTAYEEDGFGWIAARGTRDAPRRGRRADTMDRDPSAREQYVEDHSLAPVGARGWPPPRNLTGSARS